MSTPTHSEKDTRSRMDSHSHRRESHSSHDPHRGSHRERSRSTSRSSRTRKRERSRSRSRHRSERDRHRERHRRSYSRSPSRSRSRSRNRRSRSTSRSRRHTHKRRDTRHEDKDQPAPASSSSSSSGPWRYHPPPPCIPLPSNPLPIHSFKTQLREMISTHQICVVTGETGSGKSTQLCQFLYEFGYSRHGMIGVTQPRRIGAVSLAKRVSQELSPHLPTPALGTPGKLVGYSVRLEELTSSDTQIKFLTDGCLLRELLTDPNLDKYSTIIVDEAHERSLHTDVLFGLLKTLANSSHKRRHPLRLIITSATLDVDKFCNFFQAPLLEVPGRCYPVQEIFETSPDGRPEVEEVDERTYVDKTIKRVLSIHTSTPPDSGHVLAFLTGQDEIDRAVKSVESKLDAMFDDGIDGIGDVVVLGLYANLPAQEQQKIFAPVSKDTRKIIFSTNISETSLTVDGVAYVVDCGLSKQKEWDPSSGIHTLMVSTISQTSARQRAGRAGRTREGVCYRLYTRSAFEKFPFATLPEIQRTELSSTVLMLKNLGITTDLFEFEFIDRPTNEQLSKSLKQLFSLEALDSSGKLTTLGRKMTILPIEPTQARLIFLGQREGCLEEMLSIVAIMSGSSDILFLGDRETSQQASQKFASGFGDLITGLFVFESWKAENYDMEWTKRHGINSKLLKHAKEIRQQLKRIIETHGNIFRVEESDKEKTNTTIHPSNSIQLDPITAVRKCIGITYCTHLARLNAVASSIGGKEFGASWRPYPEEDTSTSTGGGALNLGLFTSHSHGGDGGANKLLLHPSSSLVSVRPPPKWLVYGEVVETSRRWMKQCTAVEWEWMAEHITRMKEVDLRALAGGRRINTTGEHEKTAEPAQQQTATASAGKVETEDEIQAREAKALQQQLLSASKATLDVNTVNDAKARYLERKAAAAAAAAKK